MKRQILSLLASMALTTPFVRAQEIATWEDWKKAAVTYTFDDAANELSTDQFVAAELEKRGFRGTFYVVTGWTNNKWSYYQTFANSGHEIGSHTDSHSSSDGELASSKKTINSNISNQQCLTIAYPNCTVPTETKVLENYIGGRICGNNTNPKSPSNFARLDCYICGTNGINTSSGFEDKIKGAKSSGGWVVFLIHGISGKEASGSWSPTNQGAFTGSLDYLDDNKSDYWVTTFRDACMYIKERDNTTITKISSTTTSETYNITLGSNLANSSICKFDYPLSIRTDLPDGWSDVVVTQSDKEVESSVSGGKIYFKAIPGAGNIVITSASAVVPDPTFKFTSEKHTELCTDSSYTISWTMEGDANDKVFSLNWNTGGSSEVNISSVTASSEWSTDDGSFSWKASNVLTDDGSHGESSRWGSKGGSNEYLVFNLGSAQTVAGIKIDEFTEYGTVATFDVQYDDNGSWKTVYSGTTVGNDFSATFSPVNTSKIRFLIKTTNGDGANINYVALMGVSSYSLKSNISGSGSYTFQPTSSMIGKGTLSINKSTGKALVSSDAITIKKCGSSTQPGDGGDNPSTFACYDGNGYTGPSCDEEGTGAYHTGVYRNLFVEYLGKTEEQVESKLNSIWNHFFNPKGDNTVYYETTDGSMGYILDVNNNDVRTEGMSYGMMISVQTDHQAEFDKIWKWAKKYMQYKSGDDREGLFAWQCHTDGSVKGKSCAPDGEAYFLTALFFASHRWGNDGEINYEKEAQYLIEQMLDKPNREAGQVSPIFNYSTYLITFGETSYSFTDPSYNLPGFFELWAKWTDTNKEFWAKTADAARNLLYNASNDTTGLYPDYSQFDGTPYKPDWCGYDASKFMYDALRCAMNVGMDYHWFGKDDRQKTMMTNILSFFEKDNFTHGYFSVNGKDADGGYSEALTGANAAGSFAVDDEELVKKHLNKLWNTSAPTGTYRYYNGMVYMLSMLNVSGHFKIWKPAPAEKDTTITGNGSVVFAGETYTASTNFCHFDKCTNYNVTIVVNNATDVMDEEAEANLQIVPNPADEAFEVKYTDSVSSIELYSLAGLQLSNVQNSTTMQTSAFASGSYIVKVRTNDGKTFVRKVAIKH